jgi:ABC-type antimicrobial peptide transport system permease subunit
LICRRNPTSAFCFFSVVQRASVIGVRIALGAQRKDELILVIGRGLKLALMGLTLGLAPALAVTRYVASLLYGVTATDPGALKGSPMFAEDRNFGDGQVASSKLFLASAAFFLRHRF